MIRSKIVYMYRDAHNFKTYGEIIVDEAVTIEEIAPYLIDGQYFIPEHVGVDPLRPMAMNEWDHHFHEIAEIEPTSLAAQLRTSTLITALALSKSQSQTLSPKQ